MSKNPIENGLQPDFIELMINDIIEQCKLSDTIDKSIKILLFSEKFKQGLQSRFYQVLLSFVLDPENHPFGTIVIDEINKQKDLEAALNIIKVYMDADPIFSTTAFKYIIEFYKLQCQELKIIPSPAVTKLIPAVI